MATALRLDDTERAHLFDLANRRPTQPRRSTPYPAEQVSPAAHQLLTTLDAAYCLAFVLGRRTDVVASNPLARALIADFDAMPANERNQSRFLFRDPAARELYADWETVAADTAAMLRMDAGRHPEDPQLGELVGELAVRSEHFRAYWAERRSTSEPRGPRATTIPSSGTSPSPTKLSPCPATAIKPCSSTAPSRAPPPKPPCGSWRRGRPNPSQTKSVPHSTNRTPPPDPPRSRHPRLRGGPGAGHPGAPCPCGRTAQ